VSIINAETSNHMIHEKEAAKCEGIFGTANSAVILEIFSAIRQYNYKDIG